MQPGPLIQSRQFAFIDLRLPATAASFLLPGSRSSLVLALMLNQHGPRVWWRGLKIDFLSLTAWQVGMCGWMALVIFVWFGEIPPTHIEFWFLMQLAIACGLLTAYPMNWWLIRSGIKTAM